MDARHSTGKRRYSWLPCLLILLTFLGQAYAISDRTWEGQNNSSQSVSCSDNEYVNDNGICCDKCPPGFKLKEQCPGRGLRSQCEKCTEGTFQERTNYYKNCFRCSKCKNKYAVEITPCTPITDTECGCEKGYYKKEINANTWSCVLCRECGVGERRITECARNMDTVCECKDFHYRVDKRTCAYCVNCSVACGVECSVTLTTKHPKPDSILPTVLIPAVVVLTVLAVGLGGYEVLRQWRKTRRRRRAAQTSSSRTKSADPEQDVEEQTQTFTDLQVKVEESPLFPSLCMATKQDLVLPDCVPREIKSHEFIYFVLDVVPIGRFKELVRRLNISEQDMERAERDNRAFFDAQYQMLKVWSDRGCRGGNSILPQSLLHECVSRLKDMNLNGCAESIESKYCPEI